ncbi:uncharacterized protein [Onthophagus taurus]|uniref:uncharacterized protein n=1 Tax=Onthophagus taurus TaxID=166361 RepID=UPI0039BDD74A
MSDPYVNRTKEIPNSGYTASGRSNMSVFGSQDNDLDEEDVLFNLIERERRLYGRPYSPLIRNEQDFLGHFDDGGGYFQRQIGDYFTSPYYGRVKPGMAWNCDFNSVKNVRFQDKQTQTYFDPDNNFFAFQPRMERSGSAYPEYMNYDRNLHYADVLRRYPHLAPSNYRDNTDLRCQYLNPYLNFPSPVYGKRIERSNFVPITSQLYDMHDYSNIRSFVNHGLSDYYQPYLPFPLSYNERRGNGNNVDFRLPPPPEYATQPTRLRRSYPFAGTMDKSGNIDQIPFDGDTETSARSPRMQKFHQDLDNFDEMSAQCSWKPLSRYSSRDTNVDQFPRSYGLKKNLSPTQLELNYVTRQKKTHKTSPVTSQPIRNITKSPSPHLNKPRTYSSINKKPRSRATLEKNEEEENLDISLQHRRASNVDISSFAENQTPDIPVCKSLSDSSIDMTDDTSYLPPPTKKTQGANSKHFSPLPKLHEEPTADPSYGPEKECNYYEENTQILDQPENSSEGIVPLNNPKISSHQKLINQRDSTEWDDVWDPNSAFTPTEMETNPGELQQWQVNEFVKEEEEFGDLADNIIECITKNNEVASNSKNDQKHIENESRKESLTIDSSAKIGTNLKTKMKFLRRSKSSRRRALDLETMYNSITEDNMY